MEYGYFCPGLHLAQRSGADGKSEREAICGIYKKGYATTFTITASEPYRRWEFDMENSSMSGHWTGIFSSKGEETEICFTEEVRAKRFFLKPFIKRYLKTQQARFVADLEAELRHAESVSCHR